MKALMFGWEFPPHILGGLGTASYGLTKGMSLQPDLEITFVIPKPWGDEDQSFLRIIGANQIPVVWKDVNWDHVNSRIGNFMSPDDYYHFRNNIKYDFRRIGTDDLGCINFSGRYPENLLEEISNYEAVASVIAHAIQFDVIHAHDWLTYPAGRFAKQISGKPMVIHVHATDYDRSRGQVNPDVYRIEKEGMDAADHIMTVSNLTRRTVIEKYHQHPDKVTTVHNAVEPMANVEEFTKSERNDKVITFLGRITMQKGPEYFVEVATRVLQHTKGVRFVMAGSG
ncbi:MAG TPA: glycosyltransferase, partial [Paludibacteraceae bacterium]|nr:glycosyltransferase [Paludibacteraceae bacterium]